MKKTLFALLLGALFGLLGLCASASAAYLPEGDGNAAGVDNIAMIYYGSYDTANYDGRQIGKWDAGEFMPYVGHLDDQGKPDDTFFDSFLFLSLYTPYGGSLQKDPRETPVPSTKLDWQWLIDELFRQSEQLDALDNAVDRIGAQLDEANKTVGVFAMIPFPDARSTAFGDITGDGVADSLASLANRNRAVEWYVDEIAGRFAQANYRHLELKGFYWLQEDADTSDADELANIAHTVQYVHNGGYKLGWFPFGASPNRDKGALLGFDFTLMQPNHFFSAYSTIDWVRNTAQTAQLAGEGIEFEFDQRALEFPFYREKWNDYLIGGAKYGYAKDVLLSYYQDVKGVYDLYHDDTPAGRAMYDELYRFVKGVYVAPVGGLRGRVVDAAGNPIAGAVITTDTPHIETTDKYGKFRFDGLYAVHTPFTVRKAGYQDLTVDIKIEEGQTLYKDLILAEQAVEGPGDTKLTLADFEGGSLTVTADDSSRLSLNTNAAFVRTGAQSLKVDFTTEFQNFRVFLNATSAGGSTYSATDWSGYDSVSAAVYNPSNETQYVTLGFFDDLMSYLRYFDRRFELAPHSWTNVEVPIADMAQGSSFNIHDVRSMQILQNINPPFKLPNTLYVDNVRLVKYAAREPVADYAWDVSAARRTLDVGQTAQLVVKDRNHPATVVDTQYRSMNPDVLTIAPNGVAVAHKPGKAVVRALAGGVEVESLVVEVSPWTVTRLVAQRSLLEVGDSSAVSLKARFANGFHVPYDNAAIDWRVNGSAVQLTPPDPEQPNKIGFQAVHAGEATLTATFTFNGKTVWQRLQVKVR
ncbi:DUF4855 domain-containing protein [Paenibacillus cymbidii]|uniref:DUF4855 domain-containing protein n=1 Tax=Paenibacillus cymbidii TaxID=1639034 RepID=UPI001080B55C|nr:DUF4855 domain-containing protein [Paenibacillus cymbidii]